MHGRKHVLLLGGLLRLPGGSPGHGCGLGSGRCGLLPGRLRLRSAGGLRSLGLPGGLRLRGRSCGCGLGLPCRLRRLGHCLYGEYPSSCAGSPSLAYLKSSFSVMSAGSSQCATRAVQVPDQHNVYLHR